MDTNAGITPDAEALHARAMERNRAFSSFAKIARKHGLDDEVVIDFNNALLERQRTDDGQTG